MKRVQIIIYGFSMFAMFFGSGNLVFPLKIGVETESYWLVGFLGLFITGILLPFLGLFVIKLHRGNFYDFFGEAGNVARLVLPFIALSLLGSFGVVPRCITVAHGGIEYLDPSVSLLFFSLIFCTVCFFICLKEQWVVAMLGKFLTPILLSGLAFLILTSVIYAPSISNPPSSLQANFLNGFLQGYQTMDLLAAFFFSSVIFNQIQQQCGDVDASKKVMKIALGASLIGAGLLSLVYFSFVFMGAHYKAMIGSVSPELILPAISFQLMGEKATMVVSVIIILSCLTTAVALNNIYARYLTTAFKVPKRFFPMILLGTTAISFGISLFDFRGISAFLIPVLSVIYPGLIVLTMMSIITKKYKTLKMVLFYGTVLVVAGYTLY